MQSKPLSFEKPLTELGQHIAQLKGFAEANPELDLASGIEALEKNLASLTKRAFQRLTRWDKVWLARHEQRPQASTYIRAFFKDPIELRGDRLHADDRALVAGLARFDGHPSPTWRSRRAQTSKSDRI